MQIDLTKETYIHLCRIIQEDFERTQARLNATVAVIQVLDQVRKNMLESKEEIKEPMT